MTRKLARHNLIQLRNYYIVKLDQALEQFDKVNPEEVDKYITRIYNIDHHLQTHLPTETA